MCLACVVVGGLGYTATRALADGDPTTQNITTGDLILPYQGYLMTDASATQGQLRMRFELFTNATTTFVRWSEEQTVTLRDGRFAVGLGAVTRLNERVLDAQKLWLGITILEDDGQGGVREIGLSGRQLIETTPYAAWSAHAADFDVAGQMNVSGSVTSGGIVNTGGDVEIGGTRLLLDVSNGGGAAVALEAADTLVFNPDNAFSQPTIISGPNHITGNLVATQSVSLGNRDNNGASARDKLVVEGSITIGGTIEVFGDKVITGLHTVRGFNGLDLDRNTINEDMRLESTGDVTIENDLVVQGRIEALEPVGPSVNTNNTPVNLGVSASEGFCYVSSVMVDTNNANPPRQSCRVRVSGGQWLLTLEEGTNANTDCEAYCVKY